MANKREVVSYPPNRESKTKLTFSSSDKVSNHKSTSRKSFPFLEFSVIFLLLFSIIVLTVKDIRLLACKDGQKEDDHMLSFYTTKE